MLRNRARYEVANNSYARGIVLTLANDVIGTGPRLQLLTPTPRPTANRTRVRRWARRSDWPRNSARCAWPAPQDGEAFAVLTSNPKAAYAGQARSRLIEADQVTTPDLKPLANAVDGIVFDDAATRSSTTC
ncbi:MAG: hypothetical protein KatS3mg082_1952 [Nitrospiraceae bacterium]|nr:MAG: hypothetical protein KatS3mg082_1952 [Nitrospiraceae bacterium]